MVLMSDSLGLTGCFEVVLMSDSLGQGALRWC